MTRAQTARAQYERTMSELRSAVPTNSREFATRASAACAAYESAMVADIGADAAGDLGAGLARLA